MSKLHAHIRIHPRLCRVVTSGATSYALLAVGWAAAGLIGFADGWPARGGLLVVGILCATGLKLASDFVAAEAQRVTASTALELEAAVKTAEDAVLRQILVLGSTVEPIAALLSKMAATPRKGERQKMASGLVEKAVEAASKICGPSDETEVTRAAFYKWDRGRLIYQTHHGRWGDPPRPELPEAACELVRERGNLLVPNVATDAPDPSLFVGVTYTTFISCAVYSGDQLHGLLSVDASEPGTLRNRDHRSAIVLAHMLGTGFALVGD